MGEHGENDMRAIRTRAFASLILTAALIALYAFAPQASFASMGIESAPEGFAFGMGVALLGLVYLTVQGYPLGYAKLGTPGAQTIDAILSLLPAIPGLFMIVLDLVNLYPVSSLNLVIGCMTIAVVVYDAWILGGAAARILHLTDEMQTVE